MNTKLYSFLLLLSGFAATAQSPDPQTEMLRLFDQYHPGAAHDLVEVLAPVPNSARGPVTHLDSTHVTDLFESTLINRIIYYADERARDTLEQQFLYQQFGADLLNSRIRRTFDDQDRVTFLLRESAPELGAAVEPTLREEQTYLDDFTSYRTRRVDEFADPQTPLPRFFYTREFTDEGRTAAFRTEIFDTTAMAFAPSSVNYYVYTDDDQIDSIYTYQFDGGTADSVLTGYFVYTYPNNGEQLERLSYRLNANGTDYYPASRLFLDFLPGTTRFRVFRLEFFNETEFFFGQEVRYGFNNEEQLTVDSFYQTDFSGSGEFLPQRITDYTYNDEGLLQREIESIWDGTNAEPSLQLDYFYSTIDVVGVQDPTRNHFACRLANPLPSGSVLDCALPTDVGPLRLRAFDLTGRQHLDEPFRNGQSVALPAGNYVLGLFDARGQLVWRQRVLAVD